MDDQITRIIHNLLPTIIQEIEKHFPNEYAEKKDSGEDSEELTQELGEVIRLEHNERAQAIALPLFAATTDKKRQRSEFCKENDEDAGPQRSAIEFFCPISKEFISHPVRTPNSDYTYDRDSVKDLHNLEDVQPDLRNDNNDLNSKKPSGEHGEDKKSYQPPKGVKMKLIKSSPLPNSNDSSENADQIGAEKKRRSAESKSFGIVGTKVRAKVGSYVRFRKGPTPEIEASVAKILKLECTTPRGITTVHAQWFYRPEDTRCGRRAFHGQMELLLSDLRMRNMIEDWFSHYDLQPPFDFISNQDDLLAASKSVVALSESIRGFKISDECFESPALKGIVEILGILDGWIDEILPIQQPARYGNPAFRQWQERLQQGQELMGRVLTQDLYASIPEIFPYFTDSFRNAMRIDYGTGHKTNFAAWLFCLARLGVLTENDYQAGVLRVFVKYLALMRRLQTTYWKAVILAPVPQAQKVPIVSPPFSFQIPQRIISASTDIEHFHTLLSYPRENHCDAWVASVLSIVAHSIDNDEILQVPAGVYPQYSMLTSISRACESQLCTTNGEEFQMGMINLMHGFVINSLDLSAMSEKLGGIVGTLVMYSIWMHNNKRHILSSHEIIKFLTHTMLSLQDNDPIDFFKMYLERLFMIITELSSLDRACSENPRLAKALASYVWHVKDHFIQKRLYRKLLSTLECLSDDQESCENMVSAEIIGLLFVLLDFEVSPEQELVHDLLMHVFETNPIFQKALDNAFMFIYNQEIGGRTSAKFFATFYDNLLRTHGSNIWKAVELETSLLNYLGDKRSLEDFCIKKLADRLLLDKCSTVYNENKLLSHLKRELGQNFISRMESMLEDFRYCRLWPSYKTCQEERLIQ